MNKSIPKPQSFGVKTILSQGTNHTTTLIFQLVASIFIARNLGPIGLGELAIIQTIIILIKPILDTGTRGYLIRELINHPNRNEQFQWANASNKLSTKVTLYILVLVLITLLIGAIFHSYPISTESQNQSIFNPQLWAYCLGFVILSNIFEKKGYTQLLLLSNIREYLKRNLVINVGSALIKILAAITIESKDLLIASFFTAMGLEYLVKGAWNNTDLKIKDKADRKIKLLEKEKKLFREAIKLLPSELSLATEGQIPKIWLPNLGDTVLGNFSVAQKNGIILRTLTRISHDADIENPTLKVGIKYAILGAIISALAAPLIPIVYGSEFSDATYYAYLLIAPGALTLLGSKVSTQLIRTSKTGAAARINILGVLVSIILCWLLIPPHGVLGAAIAISIGWTLQISLGVFVLKKNKAQ